MNMNLKGKIGRLPEALREEVNVRLRQGEKGRALVDWLNGLPEVQALLAAEFEGKPVREQNISEWRRGGHQRWLRLQEAYTMMQRIGPDAAAVTDAAKEPVTETLATWLAARYVVAAKSAEGLGDDSVPAWDRMREFCRDVMALRRGEQVKQRLEIEQERLAFRHEKLGVRAGLASGGQLEDGGLKMEDNPCGRPPLATGKSPEPVPICREKACPTLLPSVILSGYAPDSTAAGRPVTIHFQNPKK